MPLAAWLLAAVETNVRQTKTQEMGKAVWKALNSLDALQGHLSSIQYRLQNLREFKMPPD